MKLSTILHRSYRNLTRKETIMSITCNFQKLGFGNWFSTCSSEEPELKEFMKYLENLKNYEKSGVPIGAGTDSDDGFDMGRMNRLMERLGNPQLRFKV